MGIGRIIALVVIVLALLGAVYFTLKANTNLLEPKPKEPEKIPELIEAVWFGNLEQVEALLAGGADINVQEKHGLTPLMACMSPIEDNEQMFGYLLDHGADINIRAENGWTPLHHAAYNWRDDYARELVARGADINARDKQGNTPLHVSLWMTYKPGHEVACLAPADSEGCPLIYTALLEAGADLSLKDENGKLFYDYIADRPWAAKFKPDG